MATYYARKTGNINAADVWAATPSGVASAVTFASGDVLHSNNFAITVNVSTTVGEVRNDNANSATAGGSFTLADGVTLTANIFAGSTATACVNQTGTASGTIVGNSRGGTSANNGHGINKTSSGTLDITGNLTGGTSALQNGLSMTAGTVNLTGNITGGSTASGGPSNSAGVSISGGTLNVLSGTATGGTVNGVSGLYVSGGTVNFTGNAVGSSTAALTTAHGITNASTGTVTLNGNATGGNQSAGGGGAGIVNSSATGTVIVNGNAIGGSVLAGASNTSTGYMSVKRAVGNAYGPGNTAGLSAAVGASNTGLGVLEVQEIEFGAYGMSPTSGTGIRLKKANTNVAVFNYVDSGAAKTLVDATQGQMPAASDVRHGISYASGALTGTCAVPAAGSVALGVPVDATTGTAVLTPEAVWGAASRTITGGTVDTLTTPTANEIRDAVWQAAASSLTTSGSIGERLKNSATVATTGEQLAAALTAP